MAVFNHILSGIRYTLIAPFMSNGGAVEGPCGGLPYFQHPIFQMSSRYAIFVDAGYLFAQGSACLYGQKQPRHTLQLNIGQTISSLKAFAAEKISGELLRIYWYDAALGAPSPEQNDLAYHDDVKLRLGTLNRQGQQKGVDSLIVTDLVTLAQNRAIADAILVTGDEDIRVGVQLAQPFGVRVHLLGIEPARGSQSNLLRQEVDTCSEWTKNDLQHLLQTLSSESAEQIPPQRAGEIESFEEFIRHFLSKMSEEELQANLAQMERSSSLPPSVDRQLLTLASRQLKEGALLSSREKRRLRTQFRAILLDTRQS